MDHPTIIITGASRGLGAAAARIAAQLGANLVLAARSVDRLQAQVEQITQSGGSALAAPGDVSHEADCRVIVRVALEKFGGIDALVNNSGRVEPIAPISDADPREWEHNWAVNVLGPVMLTSLALPSLHERHGRVINISSGAAENVVGGWGAYGSTKAALNYLTRALASEEPEITAIALRPGIVDTEMQATIREKGRARMAESNYNRLYGLYERGQLLPPEDPGRAIACLAIGAPHEWSGSVMQWNDEPVQVLVRSMR